MVGHEGFSTYVAVIKTDSLFCSMSSGVPVYRRYQLLIAPI
jgi:hypothetical protein